MNEHRQPVDDLELRLAEWHQAEQAGVFSSTPVDAADLLNPVVDGQSPEVRRLVRRFFMVAAAALFLSVGVGTWMFQRELSEIRHRTMLVHGGGGSQFLAMGLGDPCDGQFFRCLTGPGQSVLGDCTRFDFDANGRVDLADARVQQLTCQGVNR